MRVLVVDDEAPARDRLHRLLAGLEGVEVAGEAATGREALERAQSLGPDVVLLDIRMPGMDGLEAARHLAALDTPPAVIFVTAYGDHALEAFETRAVDYLLKPVRRERLAHALAQAGRLTRAQLAALGGEGERGRRTHLSVRRRGNIQLIPVDTILYLQADQKYVTVCHGEGEDLVEESLKALEEEFPDIFVRVHRSALVARAALTGMEGAGEGRYRVCLRGVEERLEVSRRHVAAVRRLLKAGG